MIEWIRELRWRVEDWRWRSKRKRWDKQDAKHSELLFTEEDFEDSEFPPPGWTLLDEAARLEGVDPRFTFSREICNTQTIVGGMAGKSLTGVYT